TDPSSPTHKMSKYIVYESCLLELFEVCLRCGRASRPRTRTMGTFLRVEQNCPHCGLSRTWNSQPIIGSVPAGNLQLAAAVYASGASFSTLEK
ncbi:si:dkeyp-30e7.2, partial [Pimephales promelas]